MTLPLKSDKETVLPSSSIVVKSGAIVPRDKTIIPKYLD
jgi:hypothetical protein